MRKGIGAKVLLSLRTIYTSKFSNIYQDNYQIEVASKLWNKQLQEFSDEVIDEALNACISQYDWPPGIAEFKTLCKSFTDSSRYLWSDEALKISIPKGKCIMKNEIDAGAVFCKRLKNIYPNHTWSKIVTMFGNFKDKVRKLDTKKSELDVLVSLANYSDEDIYEIIEKLEYEKNGNTERAV